MTSIEDRLRHIEERNARVEIEKAWETSITRRLSVALLTYVTASLFLWLVDVPYPMLNAFVPTGGYILSTLSIPWIKTLWMSKRK